MEKRRDGIAKFLTVVFGCLALSLTAWSQTAVDASQRQTHATDFAPVTLPAIDPSLLQNTVAVSRPASPATPTIELQYDATPMDFAYSYDTMLIRGITVKNNGPYTELMCDIAVTGSDGFSWAAGATGNRVYPMNLYLQPGESQRCWFEGNWNELGQPSWKTLGATYDYRLDFRICPVSPGGFSGAPCNNQPYTQTASLHNNVHVAFLRPAPTSAMTDNNATISGRVYDAKTGVAISNGQVNTIPAGQDFYSTASDHLGNYKLDVTAHLAAMQGIWQNFYVFVQAPGYADYHAVVAPRAGDDVRLDIAMTQPVAGPSWVVQSKLDLGLNQYWGEVSKNGKYVALSAYHSRVIGDDDLLKLDAQSQLSFLTTDGKLLWQFPIYTQMNTVALSDDGSLVATARAKTATVPAPVGYTPTPASEVGVYLLNNTGQVVWFTGTLGSNSGCYHALQISHDNKYLAIGDADGNLYLADIASKKVIWQRFVNGDVRVILFESDGSRMYVESADGFFYALGLDGTVLWRSYLGSWGVHFGMTKNYFMMGGKLGYFVDLVDKTTGQTVWQFPGAVGSFTKISPDESYVAAGGSQGNGTFIFDRATGLLRYRDVDNTGMLAFGGGGSYVLITGNNIDHDPQLQADIGTTWLKIRGRDGSELWNSGPLDKTVHYGPLEGLAWISDDGGKAVAAVGNWVYFLTQQEPATLPAQAASLAASGGSISIQVTAPATAAWGAVSFDPWITITGGASGIGNGVVTISVAANTNATRCGTIVIGGQTFTVQQETDPPSVLNLAGSIAQIASAGGWDTSLTLVNLRAAQAAARVNFSGNDGGAPWLPVTFPQYGTGTTLGATFDENLAANASLIFDTTGPASQSTAGAAQMLTRDNIGAFAIFTYTPTGQAAVSPLETRDASSYLLAFDDTGTVSTGLAIANLSSTAASVPVVIRNDSGAQIGSGTVSLPAQGHNSFMLTDATYGFPSTAGVRGTIEFDKPSGGRISVLGLRANTIPNSSGFAITSLPVIANVGTGGGVLAHMASGGGWQTTFTLVNTGAAEATANLSFYDGNGAALPLPLNFPPSSATSTASSVSQSIPAGGSLIVLVQDAGGANSVTGSAVLTTTGNVGGFAVFRYNPTGQEAVVPLQVVNTPSYILAFDDTGSLSTGLAIANVAAQAANVKVVIRDDTGQQIGTGSVNLPAHGHTSFMLADTSSGGWSVTAGVRGTIEFDNPPGGRISVLGLRAATISGGFTITTIPVMQP